MSALSSRDLEAYLARLDYRGSLAPTLETLDALTFHHATAIPFENLDVLLDRPINLTPDALMAKLVHAGRGGYCFEQNNLLRLVLQTLGYRITPVGARVRWQVPREIVIPPRTHLFLRVHLDEGDWITDCELGSVALTKAIPLDSGRESATPHDRRRVVQNDGRWLHQIQLGESWSDACEFTFAEMHPIDCEIANWWTSTNPNAKFKKDLMVARALKDGTRKAIGGGKFTHRRGATILTEEEITSARQLLALLEKHFELSFPADTRFGPAGARWAL